MKFHILCTVIGAALLCMSAARAQVGGIAPASPATSSAQSNWSEFERVVKGRYGAEQLDLACEAPFDSANPLAMAAELGMRRGATQAFDRLSTRLTGTPLAPAEQRRQENEWLRQTARHKVWLPVTAETLIGSQIHDTAIQQRQVVSDDVLSPRDAVRLSQIRDLTSRLVGALPGDQPYRFRVFVTSERASSLSAHMGGHVYVSEGLLRDRGLSEADLALRIAHEIAHVTKRHVLRDFQTKLVDAYAVGSQTERDLRALTDPSSAFGLVAQRFTLAQTLARTFDHNNELEADSCAVWLAARVLSPDSLKTAIDRFEAHQAAAGDRSADGSVHPRSELRAQVMRLQLQRVAGLGLPLNAASLAAPATAPAMVPVAATPAPAVVAPAAGSTADAALANQILAMAREVARLHLADPTRTQFPAPPATLGPATRNLAFPFGWRVQDGGGKFAALYDVHESVVRSFNRAVHGSDTVFRYRGAGAFPGGRPYGGFANDSKHWILVPFSGLDLMAEIATARPVTEGDSLVGLLLNQDLLEARGIFTIDDIAAIGVLYGAADLSGMHGADANLLDQFVLYHQHANASSKSRLLTLRQECSEVQETFARKDCLTRLRTEYEAYGRKIAAGRLLSFYGDAQTRWDDSRKRVEVENIRVRAGSGDHAGCMEGAICVRVGPYGPGGNNVICYHVDRMPANRISLPMPEAEARDLSRRAGDISNLRGVSFLYEVTEPIRLRSDYRMCTGKWSRDKIMAEGRARLAGELLWGPQRSEYARRTTAAPAAGAQRPSGPAPVPMLQPAPTGKGPERGNKVVIEPK
jgi:hypothetical protein